MENKKLTMSDYKQMELTYEEAIKDLLERVEELEAFMLEIKESEPLNLAEVLTEKVLNARTMEKE